MLILYSLICVLKLLAHDERQRKLCVLLIDCEIAWMFRSNKLSACCAIFLDLLCFQPNRSLFRFSFNFHSCPLRVSVADKNSRFWGMCCALFLCKVECVIVLETERLIFVMKLMMPTLSNGTTYWGRSLVPETRLVWNMSAIPVVQSPATKIKYCVNKTVYFLPNNQ